MVDLFGSIGGVLLAICAFPEFLYTIKRKKCGLSWSFLILWFLGEVFLLVPVLLEIQKWYLVFNYTLNAILISVMMWYKWRELDE